MADIEIGPARKYIMKWTPGAADAKLIALYEGLDME